MPVLELAHVNLRTGRDQLEALRVFYRDVIGLDEGPRPLASVGYWLHAGGRDVLHLSLAREGDPPHRPGGPSANTFDHVAFACSDRPAIEARLQRAGVDFRVVRQPGLGQVQIFLRDPAGNGVELGFAERPDA